MPWASFLTVTELHRLSQKCLAPKRPFVLSDSSQCRTRSKQACLVIGVCEHTESVCGGESETVCDCVCWCKERYCGFSFLFVCLFMWCVFVVLLLQRTNLGSSSRWDERSTRSSHVLYTSKEMPLTRIQQHHSMAMA